MRPRDTAHRGIRIREYQIGIFPITGLVSRINPSKGYVTPLEKEHLPVFRTPEHNYERCRASELFCNLASQFVQFLP